jgi:hypothetical protein
MSLARSSPQRWVRFSSSMKRRVCLLGITDEVGEPCGSREYPTADCAETGVLSITRLPSPTDPDVTDIHVAGEVRFADGLEIAFSVPLVDSP